MSTPWFDTHLHLDGDDPAQAIFAAARQEGVGAFLVQGTSLDDCERTVALADPEHGVYTAVGLHPHVAASFQDMALFRDLLARPGVIAVGEIGLDFLSHRDCAAKQLAALAQQLLIARDFDLPVCLHNRKAWPEFFALLKDLRITTLRGYCHHFGASRDIARQALDHGLYLSFCGPVADPNSRRARAAALYAPLDRILSETDCPDLPAPQYHGQLSQPWQVHAVVQAIADIKKATPEVVAATIAQNWQELFLS